MNDSVGSKDIINLHIGSYLKDPVYEMDDSFAMMYIIVRHTGYYINDTV